MHSLVGKESAENIYKLFITRFDARRIRKSPLLDVVQGKRSTERYNFHFSIVVTFALLALTPLACTGCLLRPK